MSARDIAMAVIYRALLGVPIEREPVSAVWKDGAGRIFDELDEALTAAGWRLVGPGEVDAETVERAAEIAEAERRSVLAITAGYTPIWQHQARNIAVAIRTLSSSQGARAETAKKGDRQ